MARIPAGVKRAELLELLDIGEQIKQLTERKEVLRDKVLRAYRAKYADEWPVTDVQGVVIISFTIAKRLDLEAIAAAYPIEKAPSMYVPKIDTDAVPKELRDQFFIPETRMTVKRAS